MGAGREGDRNAIPNYLSLVRDLFCRLLVPLVIIFSACGRRYQSTWANRLLHWQGKVQLPPFVHPSATFDSAFLTRILGTSRAKSRNNSLKNDVAEMMPDMPQYLLSTQCSSGTDVARGIWAFAGKSRLPPGQNALRGIFAAFWQAATPYGTAKAILGDPCQRVGFHLLHWPNLNLLPLLAHPRPSISHHPQGPPHRPRHRTVSCLCSCPSLFIDFCSLSSPLASRLTSISHASPHDWTPLGCSFIACPTL